MSENVDPNTPGASPLPEEGIASRGDEVRSEPVPAEEIPPKDEDEEGE